MNSINNKTKYVDLLEEDKPIAGQKFACISFVSPENILKKKEIYYFEEFLKSWDFNKSMEKTIQFLNFMSYKYKLTFDDIITDFNEFVKEEKDNLIKSTLEDDYKTFIDQNEEKLENQFNSTYNFQTSVRGLKVRGVYPSLEEAELRCKMLREIDPNHDVYVGPVGLWIPFHPEAYKTGNVQYLEKELNELMHEKKKNEDNAKLQFDKRVKEAKVKAIKENMEKAQETNNKLTQTINEKGELVSIKNMNTQEKNLGVNATLEEIEKELFEGDTIITGTTDHGVNDLINKLNDI